MSFIVEITERVEAQFKRLWPYQAEHEFARSKQIVSEHEKFGRLSQLMAVPEAERSAEVKSEIKSLMDAASAHLQRQDERGVIQREVCEKVSDELNRLTPDTFPREDEKAAEEMYDFLLRFSKSYTKAERQRSAGPLLELLLSYDYPHAFWLWRQWIASCMAVGDMESADRLIAAATDGNTPACHHFATRGGAWKPSFSLAKAQILLLRDGDLHAAYDIVKNIRREFSGSLEVTEAYRRIGAIKKQVEDGMLSLEFKDQTDGGYGIEDAEKLRKTWNPRFLIECKTA